MPAPPAVAWVCWVCRCQDERWTWRAVYVMGCPILARDWLAAWLGRKRKRWPGIDGVVLPEGVEPVGARAAP